MLLQRVEKTLRITGMAPTRFGRESLGDPKLVFDLRNGRDPRPGTTRRILRYIAGLEARR